MKNLNLDIDAIESGQDENSAQKDMGKARILVGISKMINSESKNNENAISDDENHKS